MLAAADSLASILDRSKLGTAMAAMIRMIATTISSSIKENPFCLGIEEFSSLGFPAFLDATFPCRHLHFDSHVAGRTR
jgi:hypothetical protein